MRLRSGLKVLAVTILVATTVAGVPSPAAAGDGVTLAGPSSPAVMTKPEQQPIARAGAAARQLPLTSPASSCVATSQTRSVCLTPAKPSRRAVPPTALIPFPQWCADSDGTPVSASRTEACLVRGLVLTTYQTVNGVRTVTGVLDMNVYDYTYASASLPNWSHQIGVAPYTGWGAATNSTVTGTMAATGDCTVNGASSFPVQSLSPANGTIRAGEAGARTTATAAGAVGYCTTTWNLILSPAGYPPATESFEMAEVSCDNATGANGARPARVGCVVPWFPAQVLYSRSRYPALASHVSSAQGSGLPGTGFANPLNRNVNTADINLNRSRACGDAPSIAGKSCDEYPLATTYQGLAFGGSRRTFSGCNINAPTGVTGPTGASACMITASENNAQGGVMAGFYYDNRVLNGDPYRVGIGA